jgi:hypothetical protein
MGPLEATRTTVLTQYFIVWVAERLAHAEITAQ